MPINIDKHMLVYTFVIRMFSTYCQRCREKARHLTKVSRMSSAYQGSFCESSLVYILCARVLTVGLDRFIGGALPDSMTTFEPALYPPFTEVLQRDIDRA